MDDPRDKNLEDFLLWKAFTKDIQPTRSKDWDAEEALLRTDQGKHKKNVKAAHHSERVQMTSAEPAPQKPLTQAIHFQLDRRTDDKLRKGKMPIEGTLDLHGLNQAQAHAALEKAVLTAVSRQKRCLLVITGKGKTGRQAADWLTPESGVLKARVPEWLSVPPLSYHVLKYVTAIPSHGGSGALYVYLRRAKRDF